MIKKLAISVSHDLREELGNKQLICYVSNSVKKKTNKHKNVNSKKGFNLICYIYYITQGIKGISNLSKW